MNQRQYFTNSTKKRGRLKRWLLIATGVFVAGGVLVLQIMDNGHTPKGKTDDAGLLSTPEASAQEKSAEQRAAEVKRLAAATEGKTDTAEPNVVELRDAAGVKRQQDEQDAKDFSKNSMKDIQNDILDSLQKTRDLQVALDSAMADQKETKDIEYQRRLAKLIKIVNSMRSEEAARVIPQISEDLAVKILASLSGAKASKIVGQLDPELAGSLSSQLVKLKPDPQLKEVMENWQEMVDKMGEEDKKREQQLNKSKRYPEQE